MTTTKFKIYFQKKDIYYLLTFYLALLFLMFFFQRNLLYQKNRDNLYFAGNLFPKGIFLLKLEEKILNNNVS